MQDLLTKIESKINDFRTDATTVAMQSFGKKAAGVRSRKAARELRDLLKQWAKASMIPAGK